jgi:selenide,water dikinase
MTGRPAAPSATAAASRRLVLLGGGHAHVQVLADLARRPLAGWQVQLVTPSTRQIYSGMLPGWLAGHHPLADGTIALDALAARAGVPLRQVTGTRLDLSAGALHCADGAVLPFDRLSIDTGAMPATAALPGAAEWGLPIRPIEGFVAAWPALAARIQARQGAPYELLVLGAGAAGVELALALEHRARRDGWPALRLTLAGTEALPLPGAPALARRWLATLLARRGIAWLGGRRALRLLPGRVLWDDGSVREHDSCLVLTGAAAPAWAAASGLATDDAGFIRVGPTLQSLSHAQVFAAGDVAAYASPRPKSGVYAVRAGPVLAHNLRASCSGADGDLQAWTPQRRALYLIGTGDPRALATWGPMAWQGRWVWRWKNRIDRGFVRRFDPPAPP